MTTTLPPAPNSAHSTSPSSPSSVSSAWVTSRLSSLGSYVAGKDHRSRLAAVARKACTSNPVLRTHLGAAQMTGRRYLRRRRLRRLNHSSPNMFLTERAEWVIRLRMTLRAGLCDCSFSGWRVSLLCSFHVYLMSDITIMPFIYSVYLIV